ncbi:MAG: cation diffusion facilitator family transporter [Breznakibacter sp.]|nr:cation diffusion facilitator family transporter [Breznakibacter sp.]
MSHSETSTKSIYYALMANAGIAITKTIAAVITGSGAMLAESIHSFADCGNQGLLFLGLKAAKRKPDAKYPLGYGRATYFWSFVVAIILFSLGGLFSVYEGIHKLTAIEPIESPYIALGVLFFSILLEGFSLWGCLKEINKIRGNKSIPRWVRESRQSELVVVLGEDVAALLGLAFAFGAVIVTMLTGNPVYDAIGSIGIGVLLLIISVIIAIKIKGLLVGQSASPEQVAAITAHLESAPEINKVLNVITLQLGQTLMVSVKADMKEKQSVAKLIEDINSCERGLKFAFPDVQWSFFEPDFMK